MMQVKAKKGVIVETGSVPPPPVTEMPVVAEFIATPLVAELTDAEPEVVLPPIVSLLVVVLLLLTFTDVIADDQPSSSKPPVLVDTVVWE
jgi:hypothetical protein